FRRVQPGPRQMASTAKPLGPGTSDGQTPCARSVVPQVGGCYHRVLISWLARSERSRVRRIKSWTRAVAAMRRSAGSIGKPDEKRSDSIATSTVNGKISRLRRLEAARRQAGPDRLSF